MRTLPAAAVLPRGGARTVLAVENVLTIVRVIDVDISDRRVGRVQEI